RRKLEDQGKKVEEGDLDLTGEVSAAISMALYKYLNELHDEETRVLTMKTVSRRYSPWSSKIYSVMSNQLKTNR
ncbi:MAG: hypothetical protein C0594_06455, partial [Marinilabiliales bacterium]